MCVLDLFSHETLTLFFAHVTLTLNLTSNLMFSFVYKYEFDDVFVLCDPDLEGDLDCDLDLDDVSRLCLFDFVCLVPLYLQVGLSRSRT